MLHESINDKGILKSLFTAGGPGAGKSWVVGNLIGKTGPVSGLGAVVINSDDFFEAQLRKLNLPTHFDKSKPEQYAAQMQARLVAKTLATTKLASVLNGMLPVVVDGTGKDVGKVQKQVDALSSLGYDCDMAFVNTTLEVALARNAKRARKVADDEVRKMWDAVQKNIGHFQSVFGGGRFHIIDNSEELDEHGMKAVKAKLFKLGMKIFGEPVHNPKGKALIAALQSIGGKYISDLGDLGKQATLQNLPSSIQRLRSIGEHFELLSRLDHGSRLGR